MMTETVTVSVKSGNTLQGYVVFSDELKTPVDISGCEVSAQVRNSRGNSLVCNMTTSIGGGSIYDSQGAETVIEEGDGSYGVVFYSASDEITSEIAPGKYLADVKLAFPDGTSVSTETFVVRIKRAITK